MSLEGIDGQTDIVGICLDRLCSRGWCVDERAPGRGQPQLGQDGRINTCTACARIDEGLDLNGRGNRLLGRYERTSPRLAYTEHGHNY
jgi:hypothetical protein